MGRIDTATMLSDAAGYMTEGTREKSGIKPSRMYRNPVVRSRLPPCWAAKLENFWRTDVQD